jgi:hypothetical protein
MGGREEFMRGPNREDFASHSSRPSESPAQSWVDEHGDCLYRNGLVRVRKPEMAENRAVQRL